MRGITWRRRYGWVSAYPYFVETVPCDGHDAKNVGHTAKDVNVKKCIPVKWHSH
jgi:hypothetical protein